MNREQFEEIIPSFMRFLRERGAEILVTTNPYELLRFKANGVTSIVYTNERGRLSFTGESLRAFQASQDGQSKWRASKKKNRRSSSILIRSLLKRDGNQCFFCFGEMPENDRTLEHLLALSHGGNNHISNCVLAHEKCNRKASHLSIMEKIRMRERAKKKGKGNEQK